VVSQTASVSVISCVRGGESPFTHLSVENVVPAKAVVEENVEPVAAVTVESVVPVKAVVGENAL
jgi:hypothetical protein